MRSSQNPIQPWPKHCSPARRRNCAMPPPWAAICCSGRVVHISTTPPAVATSARPAAAATPATARTAPTPCLAGATAASRRTRPTSACRWWRSTPSSRSKARAVVARSHKELHRLPGNTPERRSALEPGDLIVAVRLPSSARGFAAHARYLKVRERTSYAFAIVSAAAALRIENGKIVEARLALGGVAAKPWRARAAEDVLRGVAPTADAFQEAARRALTAAKPSGDNAYKIELARRIIVRALTLAAAGTPARIPALPASPFASTSGAIHA